VLAPGCGGVGAPDPPPAATVEGSRLGVVEVASGLDRPVYVAAAPGDTDALYVVEQAGVVRVVRSGAVQAEPFLDVTADVLTSPRGAPPSERGLLSIAFAPDYEETGRFAVFYTDRRGDVRIVELTAGPGGVRADSARPLLHARKQTERHNGGQVQFGPDGKLYAAIGDDARSQVHPQSLEDGDLLGKVLRLDASGWQVVAYGLRNPWRFSFDRESGDLWIGDVGENRVEEIDVLRRAAGLGAGGGLANLAWDGFEGYERVEWDEGGHNDPHGPGELVWPVATYTHADGCSVVGGYVYRGTAVPDAVGRYFYGDYCTGVVWSLDPAAPGAVRRELDLGTTLVSFGEDAAGELYLVSRAGRIFRLVQA
jgi:hypothetical protein